MDVDFETWLAADDPLLWREHIRHGYARAFLLFSLLESGVFEALRRAGTGPNNGKTVNEIADECGVDAHMLDGVLHYLALSDVVLDNDGDRFWLTERGEWLFEPRSMHLAYNNVGAYSPCLFNLLPALRGEKTYGADFVRRDDMLAIGSLNSTKESYPWVVSELRNLGIDTVVDLGCGAAGVLMEFCRLDEQLRGVGIDISEDALSEARRRLADGGLADRVQLAQGDVRDPASYADMARHAGAFTCIGVLHEFLRDGEEAVEAILRQMKELFPGRYMFLGEFNRQTDEEFRKLPIPKRIRGLFYQYIMHPLSAQGLPMSRRRWTDLFERVGVDCVEIKDFYLDQYLLRF